jgi:hypothetical protein
LSVDEFGQTGGMILDGLDNKERLNAGLMKKQL